jgi:alpha-tubulin suppressor-like RCC1 family protein
MKTLPVRLAALVSACIPLLAGSAQGAEINANFNFASSVPVTASAFTATGNTVKLTLNFAPPVGTQLTVVKNTGIAFIQGTFGNLTQGQQVNLTYGGISYPFVANYFGGTGNDLVLQWANTRLLAWGANYDGQLGNGTSSTGNNGLVPTAVNAARVLAGKSVIAVACGGSHSLAACSDGTLAAWGNQQYGQLGNGASLQPMLEPVLVNRSGVLAGKTVVAVAAGGQHSVALCSDGTVAAWGENEYGQIGDGSAGWIGSTPAAVSRAGVLAGRTVVAIAAGSNHNLALCADGAMVAWGGSGGELGDGSTATSRVPVLVDRGGVLAGRTVVAIAANGGSNFALCADGFLAAWGWNTYGQLGNGTKVNSTVPVAVAMTGALSGKTIRSVALSSEASYALCSDGSLAAWGHNYNGELGNNSTTDSLTPVAVLRSGALANKTITGITGGGWGGAMAICADGSIANWGHNAYGQLGNNSTTSSLVPVLVSMTHLKAGERFAQGTAIARNGHSLALAAEVPPPLATTLAATEIHDNGATFNATAGANSGTANVTFEYGLTPAYGMIAQASPTALSGTAVTAVIAEITGLPAGTTFHFRVVVAGTQGMARGEDQSFTTTALATLVSLTPSAGRLNPAFAPTMNSYTVTVPSTVETLTLTPVASVPDAIVTVDGSPVASGTASPALDLTEGDNRITVTVSTAGGSHLGTYTVMITRMPRLFRFTAPGMVGVRVAELTATGGEVGFELAYAPAPGSVLTVIDHTGLSPISGVFDNLAHGQTVNLTFAGVSYPFVANYYGGSGNDLVLQWANTRVFGWGYNGSGQLGNNRTVDSLVPVLTDHSGVLAGKTVTAIAAGGPQSLGLCADGTLASWGSSAAGQLGVNSSVPLLVDRSGALAGKTVTAIDTGSFHSLALCADGAVASWGSNSNGELGNGSSANYLTAPVLVDRTGVLAGKTVIAFAAGGNHNLALCEDGTLAAWGCNYSGQLGNGTTADSNVPVLVDRSGVLLGRTIVAIAAGGSSSSRYEGGHSLALCSDGTVVAWGQNGWGQLGNKSNVLSTLPVLVDRTGALSGKTVKSLCAGHYFSMALCADGTVATWGANASGQLGNNSTLGASSPVLVDRTGVLLGKAVSGISAGASHGLACCTDGSLAAWGSNDSGALGNNSATSSLVPVLVNTGNLPAGARGMKVTAGFYHSQALVGLPPPPLATTLAADGITDSTATLRASVNANGGSASVVFEYGLTEAYGGTATATPGSVTGSTVTPVSASLGELVPGATYHFRMVATSGGGTVRGEDRVFTTSSLATLASLGLSSGTLMPDFSSGVTRYGVVLPNSTSSLTVTPEVANAGATVKVNGVALESGTASGLINLAVGNNAISCVVTAAGGGNTQTYTVTVTRLPATYTFSSASSVPVTVGDFTATGNPANFALAYAPLAGTALTVVKNTGMNPIRGVFDNLAQGQTVKLSYAGVTYSFVANYFGGTGNDLVLLWGHTRLAAWGYNSYGMLGNATAGNQNYSLKPVPVDMTGVLAGKAVTTITSRNSRVLALCADGTLATWGKLSGSPLIQESRPVAVALTGALSGKTVVAIASGYYHTLALCSDGTLAAWGNNEVGSLGNGSTTSSSVPVLVNREGVLKGKSVIAVAADVYHSFALCSDGTVAAWGRNELGILGNGTTTNSLVPVEVDRSGVLAGKVVTSIASGSGHALALCSDGTVAAWGKNTSGELGNNGLGANNRPALVDRTGVLSGRIVTAISAGASHSLALCSDGTLAAWGYNDYGRLGNNTMANALAPVLVDRSGVLASKTINAIFAGDSSSLVWCADASLAAWGYNVWGDVGDNTQNTRTVPVLVDTSILKTSERFAPLKSTAATYALVASPPPPQATTVAGTGVSDTGATLQASVLANGTSTAVSFEYGPTSTYGTTVSASPATVTGTTATAASAIIGNLLPGTTYHYRVIATNLYGTTLGEDLTFTTSTFCTLASLTLSDGTLTPGFSSIIPSYIATVPFAVTSLTVTPVTVFATSTVKVNNVAVASGTASATIPLSVGNNPITTVITAEDGVNTKSYVVTVTRLPEVFTFNSAASVPVTAGNFTATGNAAGFALNYKPAVGTNLTVVNNTGGAAILGAFGNLAQGQRVNLTYNGVVYPFLVNYFGGTGNDLVLQWANTRLLAWGDNTYGQLGNGTKTDSSIPTAVVMSGVLAGRTILAGSTGSGHSLIYDVTGAAASWGGDSSGQLGVGNTDYSAFSAKPVWVSTAGVLGTRTVTGIAAGGAHSLVRCSDGSLAAWGRNYDGELGNKAAAYGSQSTPFPVDHSGALAGKSVVGVAAGLFHSAALCGDGSVAVWGDNYFTQLGNNTDSYSSSYSRVPVLLNGFGALVGKQVKAIAAGCLHSLALCTDGKLVAWGSNQNGQLGNNSTTYTLVPVAVTQTGVLAGKTITAMAASGGYSIGGGGSLVLCSDGTLAAWGANYYGQLGIGTTVDSTVPVLVNRTGVLSGKTVIAIAAGAAHYLALCSDGTLASWGYNGDGQLGNSTLTTNKLPVLVNTTALRTGERITGVFAGADASHSLAIVASPPPPTATTLGATGITRTGATLNSSVNAVGADTTVSFEYGLTKTYGTTVPANPATVNGTTTTALVKSIGGLLVGTTYHYRIRATNENGTTLGADMTFTTLSDNAKLAALDLGSGMLAPAFDKLTTNYVATVPFAVDGVTVTPTKDHFGASVQVEGVPVSSGTASGVISLPVGNTTITTVVTAEDGFTTMTYTITVTRLPQEFVFNSANDVPITANGFSTGGYPVTLVLGYAPLPGTIFTMVNNTGPGFIHGTFGNLAQGQRVTLDFGGKGYDFVANYFGGTGNDLVLQWAETAVFAWGYNNYGQLGDSTTARRLLPTSCDRSGLLAGKTIVAVSGGYLHSLALCSDGTLASWGYNVFGQLGNNGNAASSVPAAVDRSGVLLGKTVIAISAGPFHNLALCSDGALVAWGYNNHGQLGTGDKVTARAPVLVKPVGALAGKQVVAVAAGTYQSFALCADGSVAAWGYNDEGELGDGTNSGSLVPVAVALSGRKVASISAGQYHILALCTDGTVLAWGYNQRGQLGNGTTIDGNVPVAIGGFGELTGKSVSAVAAGGSHSLALRADGTLAAWGFNHRGQIGVTGATQSALPVAPDLSGILAGRTIAGIIPGGNHNLARLSDGALVAWGDNANGQLGDNSTESRTSPVTVNLETLPAKARPMFGASGTASSHNLLVVGLPTPGPGDLDSIGQNGFTGTAEQDSNQNGISDLIEYAFGLGSNGGGAGRLPQGQRTGDRFEMRFTQPAGVVGISYGAEWSRTMESGSWMDITDTGSGTEHVFSVPVEAEPRVFMRLKVRDE